jgi:hypothetical protein
MRETGGHWIGLGGVQMGCDIHTTRANEWTAAESAPIRLEEWLALIQADPEMRLDGFAAAKNPDGVLRYENQGWPYGRLYSKNGIGGNMAWFDYRQGCVTAKNPRRRDFWKNETNCEEARREGNWRRGRRMLVPGSWKRLNRSASA